MVFWCLFAFVTTGFEHSIANMTLFVVVGIKSVFSFGMLLNLLFVTIGNIIGAIVFVAIPYATAAKD